MKKLYLYSIYKEGEELFTAGFSGKVSENTKDIFDLAYLTHSLSLKFGEEEMDFTDLVLKKEDLLLTMLKKDITAEVLKIFRDNHKSHITEISSKEMLDKINCLKKDKDKNKKDNIICSVEFTSDIVDISTDMEFSVKEGLSSKEVKKIISDIFYLSVGIKYVFSGESNKLFEITLNDFKDENIEKYKSLSKKGYKELIGYFFANSEDFNNLKGTNISRFLIAYIKTTSKIKISLEGEE